MLVMPSSKTSKIIEMVANGATRHCHPVAEANRKHPMGSLTPEEFYSRHSVSHSVSSFVNSQGLKIFTQSWTPLLLAEPLGIICMVHGFADESSWIMQLTSVYFAEAGFAVCALDHRGHGFSEGLSGYIPDIDLVVDDCISFFDSYCARFSIALPSFLYAESLGGAIALLVHLRGASKRPWTGMVLSGAMCGISGRIKPHWPLEHLLSCVAALVPTWPVAVTRGNVVKASFKVGWKRKLAVSSPRRHTRYPRAATALELLRVCRVLQHNFENVKLPLLIVHGGADKVCSPSSVEELYRRSFSDDKTIKIYPGMSHQLVGEPDESVELVFSGILEWLLDRAVHAVVAAIPAEDLMDGKICDVQ